MQVLSEKPRTGARGRLSVVKQEREAIRQCFLFSNHLLITTRTHAGRLHLVDGVGRISLAEVSLIYFRKFSFIIEYLDCLLVLHWRMYW